ncbi:MAG: glutamate racemase [Anaerovoracaceae bacterium]|nr:glutamate racemase [Clostridiales bacterium]
MDRRPIGFFDSGLGGLTCIPHMSELLKTESIIYFGDTARTPYGSKSVKTIKTFADQAAGFLVENHVKMIVIACNTVSATCLSDLSKKYPEIPIVGIIEPACKEAVLSSVQDTRLGIIGTKVTVDSLVYEKTIHESNEDLPVFQKACPAFVPLIEEGIINNDIMDLTIHYYLDDFIMENRIDTLILGCTHYPLIRSRIERAFPDLKIIDPSRVIVKRISEILKEKDLLSKGPASENRFYASDLSTGFTNMIDLIFKGTGASVLFKNLEL